MGPSEKRVQVKVEVGHQSVCRENRTPSGFTHDWQIFVRGADGADISHFVEKVVFILHESFHKPRRVCKEPPYKVAESGYGSFTLPVEVYFRNKEEPRKCRLEYDLTLQLVGMPPLNFKKVEAMTFVDPSEEFERKLLKGGAIILPPSNSSSVPSAVSKTDASPTSSHGSPSIQKKPLNNHTPQHMSKPKIKDSSYSQSNKRPGSVSDDPVQKPKKKKTEKHDTSSNAVLKEISILSPGGELDQSKLKTVTTKKMKERRVSGDGCSTGSPKNNPKEGKHRGKEIKSKKDKEKKTADKKVSPDSQREAKINKFVLIRTADDAWSTSTTNSTTVITPSSTQALANTSTTTSKQNERVNALLDEFARDGSGTSDEEQVRTILSEDLKSRIDPITSGSPNSYGDDIDNHHKAKKPKVHKSQSVVNGRMNGVKKEPKKPRTQVVDVSKHTNGQSISPPNSHELLEMYKKLNEIQDVDSLQRIVDIVESTGHYEINTTTFEFDLCLLDVSTLSEIKQFLENNRRAESSNYVENMQSKRRNTLRYFA